MWVCRKAITRGKAKKKKKIPCQDKIYTRQGNGVLAVALADGAGSAAFSAKGAEIVTAEITRILVNQFDYIYKNVNKKIVKISILRALLKKLQKQAEKDSALLPQYASTLLAVAIKGQRRLVLHLGDGIIGVWNGQEVLPYSLPENGEFINTTVFVTSPNAVRSLRVRRAPYQRTCGWVLMSDGTAGALFLKQTQRFSGVMDYLFRTMCYLPQMAFEKALQADMRRVLTKKTDDDCSMTFLTNTNIYQRLSLSKKLAFRGLEPNACMLGILKCLAHKPHTVQQLEAKLRTPTVILHQNLTSLLENEMIAKKGNLYMYM